MAYHIDITRTQNSTLSQVDFDNIPFGHTLADHQFVADYVNGEWCNCRIEPRKNLDISPANMALHYGQSIFEGMKAHRADDGRILIFRPDMHANRLAKSAYRMGMPDFPMELCMQAVEALVAVDADWIPTRPGTSLYIRPFIFAADEFLGVRPSDTYKFMIITGPAGAYYNEPVKLFASDQYVRAFAGGTGEAKAAGNYGGTLLPVKKIRALGYHQLLWLDGVEHKYIHECGTMNMFFVVNGRVLTPALNGMILAGVTRDTIITLLQEKNIPLEVRDITIAEIADAYRNGQLQEVFGSGTAAVVQHVSHINYNDLLMELSPINAETRPISCLLYDTIMGLRTGDIADTRGWAVEIPQTVMA
jgi:branched-chain amino acid aminotransferase